LCEQTTLICDPRRRYRIWLIAEYLFPDWCLCLHYESPVICRGSTSIKSRKDPSRSSPFRTPPHHSTLVVLS